MGSNFKNNFQTQDRRTTYSISQYSNNFHFQNMAWYFNFCAYFLPNDPVFNNNRMLMFALMGAQALFYTIMRIVIIHYQGNQAFKPKLKVQSNNGARSLQTGDKFSADLGQKDQKVKSENQTAEKQKTQQNKSSDGNDSAVHMIRDSKHPGPQRIKLGKFAEMFSTIDFLEFQKTFADFFGHHAVGLAMCCIFCPMYFVTLASLVYFILGVFCFFFHGFKYEKTAVAFFILTILINVATFFTATVNVGLLNYDSSKNQCYATQDFSQYTD